MKKLLSILGAATLVTTASANITAMSKIEEKNEVKKVQQLKISKEDQAKLNLSVKKGSNTKDASKYSGNRYIGSLKGKFTWDELYNNNIKISVDGTMRLRTKKGRKTDDTYSNPELSLTKTSNGIYGVFSRKVNDSVGSGTQKAEGEIKIEITRDLDVIISTWVYAGSWWGLHWAKAEIYGITNIQIWY